MRFILIVACLALGLACPVQAFSPLPGATRKEILGGAANLKILARATEVTIFRITPDHDVYQGPSVRIDDYRCNPKPVQIADSKFLDLAAGLSEPANFGGEFLCDFDPAFIYRFRTSAGLLDVVVCLYCGELIFYRDRERVSRDIKFAETRMSFSKDLRQAFVAAARQAYPDVLK